jgi:GAF domain-containing protein
LGEHLTGWVAANGRPMLNSDAALDLGALVPNASPTLTLCLSVPLFRESERLTGVLSLYSGQHFTTDQLDTACLLATSLASALALSTATASHQ